MRRPGEEWRTNRSMGAAAATAAPRPQVGGAPVRAPGQLKAQLADVGRRLIELSSRVGSVRWSLSFIGVLGYIFASTTYRLPIGAASVVLALAGLLFLPGRFRFPPSAAFFSAFLVWAAIGAFASRWPTVAGESLYELAKVALIFLAMVNALRTRSHAWFFMVFFLACFGTHPARGALINYLTGNTIFGRNAWYMGIFSNPNDFGALVLLQLSMAVALLMTERSRLVRLGALFATALFPFLILTTQSRGVFLALSLFVLLSVMGLRRKMRGILVIGALGAALVAISPSGVWERVQGLRNIGNTEDLRTVDEEGSAEQRYLLVQVGLRIAAANPVVGVGLGTIPYANDDISAILGKRDAHNTYITVAAENGIPGLLLFLLLVGSTIWRSRRIRKRVRDSVPGGAEQLRYLELGLICFLVAAIFGSYSKLSFLYVHIALIWALASACEAEDRTARSIVLTDTSAGLGARAPARG